MSKLLARFFICSVAVLGLAQASLTTSVNCTAAAWGSFPPDRGLDPIYSEQSSSNALTGETGPLEIDCSASQTITSDAFYLTVESSAVGYADYGRILVHGSRAYRSYDVATGAFVDNFSGANGEASFDDVLTLLDVPAGAILRANLSFQIFHDGSDATVVNIGGQTIPDNNGGAFWVDIPFTPGVPIPVSAHSAIAFGSLFAYAGGGVDVYLQLVDQQEKQIGNFTYYTRSGASYGLGGTFTPIPEPATAWLFGIASAGILVFKFKRRKNNP